MRRGDIFVGDLMTAVASLEASEEVTRQIAALLRLDGGLTAGSGISPEPADAQPIAEGEPADKAETAAAPSDADVARHIPSHLEALLEESAKTRIPFRSSGTLPASSSEENELPPPFEPLLRPAGSRAIVTHALSTRQVTGIDVERAVDKIAARERLDPLPLRLVATMRRGVQLLIDAGTGMVPFRRDQTALGEWIEKVAGSDRVIGGSFIGTPLIRFFGAGPRRPYEFPAPLTPVVLLTDLGIGRPRRLDNAASVPEWLAFAEQLRRARCPGIAFVPYPRRRWPIGLRRVLTILEWDRALTASRVRRAR